MKTLIIIMAIVAIVLVCIVFLQRKEIKVLQKDIYNVQQRIVANHERIRELIVDLEDARNESAELQPLHVSYYPSESDIQRYKDENRAKRAIRQKMTVTIANDIISNFGNPEEKDGGYVYDFLIKKA